MARRLFGQRNQQAPRRNASVLRTSPHRALGHGKRSRGSERQHDKSYLPPEDWYEPQEDGGAYRVIEQPAGKRHVHVVTAQQVRERLDQLPRSFTEPLEVVQLSRMTRKKASFPCYGMQWGRTIYLYPLDEELTEYYDRPPRPAVYHEARLFGGRWVQREPHEWLLVWTLPAARDFYLNNVLIHELGHLLDSRNSSFRDRERFAEWFATEHGYRASRGRR